MPNTRNQTENGHKISGDTSRRVQISLRISRDIGSNLDAVVGQSPLNRNEWIEQAIAEKLFHQQQEESRLDRLERQVHDLLRRRDIKTVTYQGKTMTLKQWSDETGVPERTIRERHQKGLPPEEILRVLPKGKRVSINRR